jgi:hypothetical protein
MNKLELFIQATSKTIVSAIGLCALAGSAWNGSPVGQAINSYFSKAPAVVAPVAKPSKCKSFEGVKYCK